MRRRSRTRSRAPPFRTRRGPSPCTPGASACSASCRGACWPTWRTWAIPRAMRSRSMPASPTPNQLNDPDPRLVANPTPDMIDRTTGNVLPTNLIRPNYPGRGGGHPARLPRRAVPQLQRDPDGSPPPAGRMASPGPSTTPGRSRSSTPAYDWFRTPEDNESRNTHKTREPGSRPHNAEDHLQLDDAGTESASWATTCIAKAVFDGWQLSGISTFLGGT